MRDRLRARIPALVGSRSTTDVELKRAFILADFAVRVAAPIAMDAAGMTEYASSLRALPEIVDAETASVARSAASAARDDADAAAYAAAYASASAARAAASYASYAATTAYAADASARASARASAAAAAAAADADADAAAYAADAWDAFFVAFDRALD